MTAIHLAVCVDYRPDSIEHALSNWNAAQQPALLTSFVWLKSFQQIQSRLSYRNWVLDSGAFSAWNSGETIDLQEYIDCAKYLMANDPTLDEVYALDVIGDWRGSLKNTEEMWKQGVPAIPTFHIGEPEHALLHIAKEYPKIALGAWHRISRKKRVGFVKQCFARVWPKRVHGFAMTSREMLRSVPFETVDSTTWAQSPLRYGSWRSYGRFVPLKDLERGERMTPHFVNLRPEVEWYRDEEKQASFRWAAQLKELADIRAEQEAQAP